MYEACGFAISSDLRLPLPEVSRARSDVALPINASHKTYAGDAIGPGMEMGEGWIALRQSGVATFHISAEAGIQYALEPDGDELSVATFLLLFGLPTAALLSGQSVLWGHCLDIGAHRVLLLGENAAGKNELAAALCTNGHQLVSAPFVSLGQEAAAPSPCVIPLARRTVDHLGIALSELTPTRPDHDRYHWLVPPRSTFASRPISAVYSVGIHTGDTPKFADISGAQKFHLLRGHTHLPQIWGRLGLNEQLMRHVSAISQTARFRQLTRPIQGTYWTKLAALLVEDLNRTLGDV